jgi:hypothetical protein
MRLPDESYVNATTDNEEEEEQELDNDSIALGDSRVTDESTASTATEGGSFIDNSFLHTISSANKKYVQGRKLVKASGRQQQLDPKKNKKTKTLQPKQLQLDDDEDRDELIGELYYLVCSVARKLSSHR